MHRFHPIYEIYERICLLVPLRILHTAVGPTVDDDRSVDINDFLPAE